MGFVSFLQVYIVNYDEKGRTSSLKDYRCAIYSSFFLENLKGTEYFGERVQANIQAVQQKVRQN